MAFAVILKQYNQLFDRRAMGCLVCGGSIEDLGEVSDTCPQCQKSVCKNHLSLHSLVEGYCFPYEVVTDSIKGR